MKRSRFSPLTIITSGLFLVCSSLGLSADAQQPDAQNYNSLKDKITAVKQRMGFYMMGPSWHSDRDMHYNEFNPGGALTYHIGKLDRKGIVSLDVLAGGY